MDINRLTFLTAAAHHPCRTSAPAGHPITRGSWTVTWLRAANSKIAICTVYKSTTYNSRLALSQNHILLYKHCIQILILMCVLFITVVCDLNVQLNSPSSQFSPSLPAGHRRWQTPVTGSHAAPYVQEHFCTQPWPYKPASHSTHTHMHTRAHTHAQNSEAEDYKPTISE